MSQKTELTRVCNTCNTEQDINQFNKSKGEYRKRTCKTCFNDTFCCKCGKKSWGAKTCTECTRKKPHKPHDQTLSIKAWLSKCLISTKQYSNQRKRPIKENDLNVEFLLDLWNSQSGKCAITNLELQTTYRNPCSASIDRIDPKLGYLKDNIILACQWANMGRGTCAIDEFKAILNKLVFRAESVTTA